MEGTELDLWRERREQKRLIENYFGADSYNDKEEKEEIRDDRD